MARKRQIAAGQGSLFDAVERQRAAHAAIPAKPAATKDATPRQWRMPELEGRTIAEIRLRWPKRLTPAQVARVEAELGALPRLLTKLGFGTVSVERAFVRRRKS